MCIKSIKLLNIKFSRTLLIVLIRILYVRWIVTFLQPDLLFVFFVKSLNYLNRSGDFFLIAPRLKNCILSYSRNLTRASISTSSNLAFFRTRRNAYPPPCAPVGNKDGEARVSVKRWQCYHHQYVSRSYVLGPIRTIRAATHTRACQTFTT